MTDSNYYVEPDANGNQTIWERAIAGLGRNQNADHVVVRQGGGVPPAYQDLAFAVLARVLAPDEATVERMAMVVRSRANPLPYPGVPWEELDQRLRETFREQARAVLAALAEDPAEVSP